MPVNSREELRELLSSAKVIAVVGHSDNPTRTSYQIGRMLKNQFGYTVYPVNPSVQTIDGDTCYPTLKDVPVPIDIVNVFRRPEHLLGVVKEAVEVGAKSVWAQLGIADAQAAEYAESHGLQIVMDKCIKVVYYQVM